MKRLSFADRASIRGWGTLILGMSAALLAPSSAAAVCSIEGPTAAQIGESFTLCGPPGNNIAYEWHGPGVGNATHTSCITVDGREAGTFEFELITRSGSYGPERCTHVVRVGSGAVGSLECLITGPTSIPAGTTVELCAPSANFHTYIWSGPGGFTAGTRCVTVSDPGIYDLTIRNDFTGFVRQCTHRLVAAGANAQAADCAITGPSSMEQGSSVQLCGPPSRNGSYRWTGPAGFVASTPCVDASEPGDYLLVMRDPATGGTVRCGHRVELVGDAGGGGLDQPVSVNCPQALGFWRSQCPGGTRRGRDLTDQDLRQIARQVDSYSRYFAWNGNPDGLCQALRPARPLTIRKQVAEYFAALLANVAAGELNVATAEGADVSLDMDTPIDFRGATSIRQLVAMVDRLLLSSRGNYAGVAQYLRSVSLGQGIGPVCE